MICKTIISSDRCQDLLYFLETMRLPEEAGKSNLDTSQIDEHKEILDIKQRLNDPHIYGPQIPFLIYDENNETIISRTAKGINEGKLNPFQVDWMEVTLYETDFVRQLLELIDSLFMKDVAQAIDDEDQRLYKEDGQYSNIASNSYGTGQGSDNFYSYTRDNWSNDGEYVLATSIAEGILDKRNKAEAYQRKIEFHKENIGVSNVNDTSDAPPPCFTPTTDVLYRQIEKLKGEVNQLTEEKSILQKNYNDLLTTEKHQRAEKESLLNKLEELKKTLGDNKVVIQTGDVLITEGRKIDVIKILHAMCNIGLFQLKNGKPFTTKAVMEFFGKMLNDDFSTYSSNLSVSKTKTKAQTFLEIFDKLRDSANNYLNKS